MVWQVLRNNRLLQRNVQQRLFSITNEASKCAKSTGGGTGKMLSAARQGKIMGKLFGNRIAGSKKRWYPHADTANGSQPPAVSSQSSQFGKSGGNAGKNTSRRISVLNKLFMTHITDLLATGEASEAILGRGMQVTRVKVSADFASVNVYWHGNGAGDADAELETELQRCTGVLRHELSQLRLMGEVPRIKFVRDKFGGNLNQVEALLRGIDFKYLDDDVANDDPQFMDYNVAQSVRREFYGNASMLQQKGAVAEIGAHTVSEVPEMRHDVLGLDHRDIKLKILTKMRKSKEAWTQHNQSQNAEADAATKSTIHSVDSENSLMRNIQLKLKEAADSSDKFDAFLAKQRRERKQTPERKKFRSLSHEDLTSHDDAGGLDDPLALMSPQQRSRYSEEDYLIDDQLPHDKQK